MEHTHSLAFVSTGTPGYMEARCAANTYMIYIGRRFSDRDVAHVAVGGRVAPELHAVVGRDAEEDLQREQRD